MEWAPILISILSLGVSGYALWRVIQIDERRNAGRKAVANAIEDGNLVLAWMRAEHPPEPEQRLRYDAWMQVADAALQKADGGVHLGFFNAEIVGLTKHASILAQRLRRLQEILDKL